MPHFKSHTAVAALDSAQVSVLGEGLVESNRSVVDVIGLSSIIRILDVRVRGIVLLILINILILIG